MIDLIFIMIGFVYAALFVKPIQAEKLDEDDPRWKE